MKSRTIAAILPLLLGIGLAAALAGWLAAQVPAPVLAEADATTRYVAPGGVCGGPTPCYASPQAAVDASSTGDVIRVAAGTYSGVSVRQGITQVVYLSRTLTIRGGYTTVNWTTANPLANPTTFDAQGLGRVMYVSGSIAPSIEGLRLRGGKTTGAALDSGAGIAIITATAILSGNQIFGNNGTNGGGIWLNQSASRVTHNSIYSNTAQGGGGAMYVLRSAALLENNTMLSNTAGVGGGALFLSDNADDGGALSMVGNTLSNNAAPSGGGIYIQSLIGSGFTGNTFLSNTATTNNGGGIYMYICLCTFAGNAWLGNTASNEGGGAYTTGQTPLFIHNQFMFNRATNGGGLRGGYVELERNTFVSNTADFGGAVYLQASSTAFTNTLFADNYANNQGSALYLSGAAGRLLQSTFARNSGGDGSGIALAPYNPSYPTSVVLTNSIIVRHSVGISAALGTSITLHATLWGSGATSNGTDTRGAGFIQTAGVNIHANPSFVGAGDYHLAGGSPAVNVGVPSGAQTDIDGEPRPMGPADDLGFDEVQAGALRIAKTPSAYFADASDLVSYTLLVTNDGFAAVNLVRVTDTLPVQQQVLSAATSLGSCGIVASGYAGSVACSLGTLAVNATARVTVAVQLTSTKPATVSVVTNTAQATGSGVALAQTQATLYFHDCSAIIGSNTSVVYHNVQAAVDAAANGDVVKVAGYCGGVAQRGNFVQHLYIAKTLTVRGGYTPANWTTSLPAANPTTLNALGRGRALAILGAVSPLIEGLRLTGGDASILSDGQPTLGFGGGGVLILTATATLSNNWIIRNNGGAAGGGLALLKSAATLRNNLVATNTGNYGGGFYLDQSPATLSGNTIMSNTASNDGTGGGLYLWLSSATLSANQVLSNTAYDGGGLFLDQSAAHLNGNTIEYNRVTDIGGGAYLSGSDATLDGNSIGYNGPVGDSSISCGGIDIEGGNAALSHNIVTHNLAASGGGICSSGSLGSAVLLDGNIVAHNQSETGGGLYLCHSTDTFRNNVVNDNSATLAGSGFYIDCGSALQMQHNTIAHNTGGDGSGLTLFGSSVVMTNTILVSHTVGISASTGSLATLRGVLWFANGTNHAGGGTVTPSQQTTGNPAFAADGYHLLSNSAAIDKGIASGPVTDIDGNPRPLGAAPDLGADEFVVIRNLFLPLIRR